MLWGYAGVFPGEFKIWDGDQTLNKLRFIGEQGFKSTSTRASELRDPARRDQILALVEQYDLQLTLHPGIRWLSDDSDQVKQQTEQFLADLAELAPLVRTPICTTGAGGVHRFMDDPPLARQLDLLAERMAPVARACRDAGRPLGIENHGDYYCSDLVELCQRVPGLGIFLDTGNCCLVGEKPVPGCREAAPYTIGTHFKDHYVQPQTKGGLAFLIQGAPLGEGHVGLREIYEDLIRLAPEPAKLVMQWEMVPPKDPPMDGFECLERSWRFVRSLPEVPGDA